MTVNKHFAQDDTALDDHMDALIEVLAELLGESKDPAAAETDNSGRNGTGGGVAFRGPQSDPCGGEQPGKVTELRLCL
jgi:hypothetical protein